MAAAAVAAAAILAGIGSAMTVSDGYREGRRKYNGWKERYTAEADDQTAETDSGNTGKEKRTETAQVRYADLPEVDFDGLLTLNPDVAGWLYLPAAEISYPIVQGNDNAFYLHRSLERKELFAGCLFLDAGNEASFLDRNSIIYGHNMRDGSMFAGLKKLLEDGTVRRSPHFWICTPAGNDQYRIFSVHAAKAGGDAYRMDFPDASAYAGWLRQMQKDSEIALPEIQKAVGNTVTLSTCTSDPDIRLLVHGICTGTDRSADTGG